MYRNPITSITVAEALRKMERYCAYQERCHKDVEDKLRTMKLIPEAKEKIILHLLDQNFLNEERFAKAFARGKFNIKKWGKQRIVRELKFRNISPYNIKTALKEIPEKDYFETFHKLAEKKYYSITEQDKNKKRKKLIDYLLYRGWETTLVYEKVNELIL
ncbi:regulatory protein [Aquimarina sp. EL_43]|uniref:regulatory protein RecX n=1 Tax=Aquimarina TaxID=290174 RepID=UPI0004709652|nr:MULTISPECIES: regulatory protein RecX [Aquimarina]MBG6132003.1 regulatory protein [Aquimarina sp. EL_35]MBG6149567.1 regulatory protein [Aquimarina sp. EL_32]MBG6170170.1 regulatory protein [Aquimarina sp. EL_43]